MIQPTNLKNLLTYTFAKIDLIKKVALKENLQKYALGNYLPLIIRRRSDITANTNKM
jgi:hypothetical protein